MPVIQRRRVSIHAQQQQKQQDGGEQEQEQAASSTLNPPKVVGVVEETSETTLHWNDLPHWLRDNQHILTGYRPASASFHRSFKSLTYIHNETINIYSHLLPFTSVIPCSLLLHRIIAPRYETATSADILAFGCFFSGTAFCLGSSALYHTISNHSPLVAYIGNACDYVGIVALITGSFIPSIYYGFYCRLELQRLYWGMISLLGVGCGLVATIPRFRTPAWRSFRASMFVALGLSALFPVIHGIIEFGFEQSRRQIGLVWVVLQGSLYIIGAVIYALRVPESRYPGKFDIVGHSHQIFHVLVVLAACAHLTGLLKAFDYRHSGLAPTC